MMADAYMDLRHYPMPEIDLEARAYRVLDLIVAEFTSDPMSVQCFDLRTVAEATNVINERKRLERAQRVPPILT